MRGFARTSRTYTRTPRPAPVLYIRYDSVRRGGVVLDVIGAGCTRVDLIGEQVTCAAI